MSQMTHDQKTEAAMKDAGVKTEDTIYEDYFGFEDTKKFYFPDKRQWIEFSVMNEGQKAQFQKATNRDVVLERVSGNARMKMDQSSERHELLKTCVKNWHMRRAGEEVGFSDAAFGRWLLDANPKLVEDLEREVRKANPWLMADMSVEDIDREMENLREMRETAVKRDEEKASSSSK